MPDASAQVAEVEGEPSPPVEVEETASSLLDAPISRSEYVLGPGDQLQIAILGDVNLLHSVTIAPEGSLLIPDLGIINVLGLNLDEAEARVRGLVLRFYRGVNVNVNLSSVRFFKVFVVGQVDQPGVRVASSAMRVGEVVPTANSSGTLHRNTLLRRATGDSLRIDLASFLLTGDLGENPTLREGDVLVVPYIDETVTLSGPVAYPGQYDYKEGETLSELLRIANGGGGFPSRAADSIRIARFEPDGERIFLTLGRADVEGEVGASLLLRPFDAIYIPEIGNFREPKTATISGQVARPGTYPIRPDTTTVRDLIVTAGGFTPEASLVNATLRRPRDVPLGSTGLSLEDVRAEFLSDRERRVLQSISAGDENNVVIDFQALFAEGADVYNQPLRSGDILTVPEARNEVLVSGAVISPGIVQFVPDRPLEHFIALAGGYGSSADIRGMVVIKSGTGARVDRRDIRAIEPGDQIVVPFKQPRSFLDRVQITQGVFNTISGIVLAAVGISRLF